MARIRFYPEDNTLHPSDHILGTDEQAGGGATRVFTVEALTNYLSDTLDLTPPIPEDVPVDTEPIGVTSIDKQSVQTAPWQLPENVSIPYGFRTSLGENRMAFATGDALPFSNTAIEGKAFTAVSATGTTYTGTLALLRGQFSYASAEGTRIVKIFSVDNLSTNFPIADPDTVEGGDYSGTVNLSTSFMITDAFMRNAQCFGGDTVFGNDITILGDIISEGVRIDLSELMSIINNNATSIEALQTEQSNKADRTELHPGVTLPQPNPTPSGPASAVVTGISIDPLTQELSLTRGTIPVVTATSTGAGGSGTNINFNGVLQDTLDIQPTPTQGNVVFSLVGTELTANVDLIAATGPTITFDDTGDPGHNVIFTDDSGAITANVDLTGYSLTTHSHNLTDLLDVEIDPALLTGGEIVFFDFAAQQFKAEPSTIVTSVEQLDDLIDVFAPSPTDGQALIYDGTNARWINSTPAFDGDYNNLANRPSIPDAIIFTDGVDDLDNNIVGVNFTPNTVGPSSVTATVDLSNFEIDISAGIALPAPADAILNQLFILTAVDSTGRLAGLYRFDGTDWVTVATHTTGTAVGVEWFAPPATGTLEVPDRSLYALNNIVYVNNSGASIIVNFDDTTPQAGFTQVSLQGVDDLTIERLTNTLQVKDLGITTDKIAGDAVTTAKVVDLNITTDKIADQAIVGAKLSPALPLAERLLQIDTAGDLSWVEPPDPVNDAMILFRDVIQAAGMDYAARILSVENSLLTFSSDIVNTPEVVSLGLDTQGAQGDPTIVHWKSDGGSVADIPAGIYPVAIGKDPQEYTGFATVDLSTLSTDIISAAAGNGLVYDATDFHIDVDVDDTTIEVDATSDKVQVKDQGITAAKLSPVLPGAERVLQVDAAGDLSWVTPQGGTAEPRIAVSEIADSEILAVGLNILTGNGTRSFSFPQGIEGEVLYIKNYGTLADDQSITLTPFTGEKIDNLSPDESLVINHSFISIHFIYSSTYGWVIIN